MPDTIYYKINNLQWVNGLYRMVRDFIVVVPTGIEPVFPT